MNIPKALQPQALLIPFKALAQHLRNLIDNDPSLKNLAFINSCLLDQIHVEAIPSSIYNIWLFLASQHSYDFVPAALQDLSRGVRKAGIQVARYHLFRGLRWKSHGWDLLGGAQGIKEIFDELPLAEVIPFAKAISAHAGSFHNREVVMECMEELLSLLVKDANAWTSRSLSHGVSFLYAYCTAEKVTEFLSLQKPPIPATIFSHLLRFHTTLLRNIALGAIKVPLNVRQSVLKICGLSLLRSGEAYVPIHLNETQSNMSPGLVFGVELLLVMEKEPNLHSHDEITSWIQSVLSLVIREQRQPLHSFLETLKSSLALSRSRNSSNWLSQDLPKNIIQFWSIARCGHAPGSPRRLVRKFHGRWHSEAIPADMTSLEQCLTQQVLQINDNNLRPPRTRFTQFITDLLSLVKIEARLEFLQLLCRHAPTLNFDLTAWPPSEEERQLIPVWDYEVLRIFPPDSSKALFKRSLEIYHCDEFLPDPEIRKENSWSLSWNKQCLLWACWELSEKNGHFLVTRKVLRQMKQKAMRVREHNARLKWAEAAIELAARTQLLDIFGDVVNWSKRYLRDPLVFPRLITKMFGHGGYILSCSYELQLIKQPSKPEILELVQKANEILADLLESTLLLLREPWSENSVRGMIRTVPNMLSTIAEDRMNAIRNHPDISTESELVEHSLDPLIPMLIEYEREGNAEGQTDLGWSGISSLIPQISCSSPPSRAELTFMDRLAKSRNEFWEQHRIRKNPDVLNLDACFPRGLPIQYLVKDTLWLCHAIKRPDEAPYLSSRVNDILFSSLDTMMTVIPDVSSLTDCPVDSLSFAIDALIADSGRADKVRHVLRIWEDYSSKLQPYPLYLKQFRDWLSEYVRYGDASDAYDIIRPPVQTTPKASGVPLGSEIIEWDPQDGGDDDDTAKVSSPNYDRKPKKMPCITLNCRMQGQIPADTRFVTIRPGPAFKPLSLWSVAGCSLKAESRDNTSHVQDSLVLSALLFLDSYTQTPRILQTQFPPNIEHPRFTPIYLADEFIARETKENPKETLRRPVFVLRKCAKRIPSQILRDLIGSFLDTLKADPKCSTYSKLLVCTFDLIEILLSTDQPQLAVDIVLRVWKEFAHDSSSHRKISLFKIGRILRPKQASDLVKKFARHVCEGLETQQQPGENKIVIKVTTAKMLGQVLAEAEFLSQSARMQILQNMLGIARHIDIRREIMASILAIVRVSDSPEPYKAFTSIGVYVAGPNERYDTNEEDWIVAESKEGPLPSVAASTERPMLELAVETALFKIPERLRSGYVQTVLLPLVEESSRQHFRWMTSMVARMGLSISDLGITQSAIGPFSPNLIDTILWTCKEYLPGKYLQDQHRNWALSYLHSTAFSRIAEELDRTTDCALKDRNVQDHWSEFLKFQRSRPVLYNLNRLLAPNLLIPSNDFSAEMILEDFEFRAEVVAKNPVRYNGFLGKYIVLPGYTIDILRDLRRARVQNPLAIVSVRPKIYDKITQLMMRIIDICGKVRKGGWSTELAAKYPVTLPTNFEYDVFILPSPLYNPAATSESNSAGNIFISSVINLIRKYASSPALLIKLDVLREIVPEVCVADIATCALRLGRVQHDEKGSEVEVYVRVTLARTLLNHLQRKDLLLNRDILDMIEEWKRSDVETVRRIGWEYE